MSKRVIGILCTDSEDSEEEKEQTDDSFYSAAETMDGLPASAVSNENVLAMVSHMRDLWNSQLMPKLNELSGSVSSVAELVTNMQNAQAVDATQQQAYQTTHMAQSSTSPAVGSRGASTVMKWNMRLERMDFGEMKIFVDLFNEYCDAQCLTETEARVNLFQSLSGQVLRYACSLPKSLSSKEVLERLLERVRPTQATIWNQVLKTRQRKDERVTDYVVRYKALTDCLGANWLNNDQLCEVFMDSLTRNWVVTARGLKRHMSNASFEEFTKELAALDSGIDAMEIDLVNSKRAMGETERHPPGRVIENGRVNFENITNVGRLMIAAREIFKNSPREAAEMRKFLSGIQSGGRRFNGERQRRPQNGVRRMKAQGQNEETEWEIEEMFEPYEEDDDEACASGETSSQALTTQQIRIGKEKNEGRIMKLPVVIYPAKGVCTKAVEGLLDTGADKSIVSLSVIKELELEMKPDSTSILMADGSSTSALGKVQIRFAPKGSKWGENMTAECLVMKSPGYDFLIGMDVMENNEISIHTKERCVRMKKKKFQCRMVKNWTANVKEQNVIGKLTECVDNLPLQAEDRVLFPINRSLFLAPHERKVIKMPVVLKDEWRWRRNAVVNPKFSTQLGSQLKNQCVILVTNHTAEPLKMTPRTVVFDVGVNSCSQKHGIITNEGKVEMIREQRKNFRHRA